MGIRCNSKNTQTDSIPIVTTIKHCNRNIMQQSFFSCLFHTLRSVGCALSVIMDPVQTIFTLFSSFYHYHYSIEECNQLGSICIKGCCSTLAVCLANEKAKNSTHVAMVTRHTQCKKNYNNNNNIIRRYNCLQVLFFSSLNTWNVFFVDVVVVRLVFPYLRLYRLLWLRGSILIRARAIVASLVYVCWHVVCVCVCDIALNCDLQPESIKSI